MLEKIPIQTTFNGAFSFEACWGCHEEVFNFIGSITQFTMIVRDYNGDVRDALLCEPLFFAHAQKLELMMLQWVPKTDLSGDLHSQDMSMKSSKLFRDAALLYFYRVTLDTSNSDPRVQKTIRSLLDTLGKMKVPSQYINRTKLTIGRRYSIGRSYQYLSDMAIVRCRLRVGRSK
jgi:hypothetical protein